MKTDIQRDIYEETLRKFNAAAAQGIADSDNVNISDTFLDKIRKGNEVFSAFKTHSMQNESASRLLDGRGRLKPFYKWKEDVRGITNHFYGPWLKTEYNTAVIRAHRAADWQHFVDEADVYPNVRWMPTTSPNQDPLHRQYWASKLTLPVNHPFWDEHHPGDRWNCKCTLRQTDEPANDSVIKDFYPIASQKGLENNPGKDGHLFSDSHSYFPKSCSSCEFYKAANKGLKNRIGLLFNNRKKDCNNCPYINGCLDGMKEVLKKNITPPEVENYISYEKGMVMVSPYHGPNEQEDNKRIAKLISSTIGEQVYLLPRISSDTLEQLELRKKLLPNGVFNKKNPDFFIGGKFFEGKSMFKIEKAKSQRAYKTKIENKLKKAKQQSYNIIIDMPDFIGRDIIQDTITNYLENVTDNERIIIVIKKEDLLIFSNIKNKKPDK